MKRRTNPTASLPHSVFPSLPLPQHLIDDVELWGYTFADSRPSSVKLRSDLESSLAESGVSIVRTSALHRGCAVHHVNYLGRFAFSLSVGLGS